MTSILSPSSAASLNVSNAAFDPTTATLPVDLSYSRAEEKKKDTTD